MWSAVLLPLRKPDCVFDSRSNVSIGTHISRFVTSLSISLLSVDVSVSVGMTMYDAGPFKTSISV